MPPDKILLDTTELIDLLRGNQESKSRILRLINEGFLLGTCSIVIAEVLQGAKDSEKEATEDLLDSLHDFSMTKECGKLAGRWLREYRKKGITLSVPDALIAATASHNQAILVTSNVKHFPMTGLKLIKS